jgi:hypothetical protein
VSQEEEKASIGDILLFLTILGMVWVLITWGVLSEVEEDRIIHCRIDQFGNESRLMGVRNYRSNITIKTITSIDEGIEIARKLGCRMETEEDK